MYDLIVEIFCCSGWSWRQGGKGSKWIGYPSGGGQGGLGWGYNILESLFKSDFYRTSGSSEIDKSQSEGSLLIKFNPDHPPQENRDET